MKKISIVLLAVFFIGIANVNAQSEATTETVVGIEEVKDFIFNKCAVIKIQFGERQRNTIKRNYF